jgi:para-nitrobenzyl esterase
MTTAVKTRAGVVEGTTATVDGRAIRAFRGIPYARVARFEPPLPVTPWSGTVAAARFGPACPQVLDVVDNVPGAPITDVDEDCLSLNVWSPADADGDCLRQKPVMVWFHGGAFAFGASSQAVYDGARLAAEQDVVVVTANYRVGAFGFLDTRSLGGGGANFGMQDAIAALEWVRDNISGFGGDPGCVTAFGESAGGGLVLHLLASARSAGLLHRAIVQSAAADTTLTPERAALVAATVAETLGVDDIEGLRRLPADVIVAAQPKVAAALLKDVGRMAFHPSIDDRLLDGTPAAAFATGVGAGVPLLAGTTSEEMRLYVDPQAEAPARAQIVKRVSRYLEVDAARAETIIDHYAGALGTDDLGEVWVTLFSDAEMHVPLRRALDAHAQNAPTFTYLFSWRAPDIGAFHAVDLPFTFGTFDADGWGAFVGVDDDARALSTTLRDAWAAFARDGAPPWPGRPATMVFDRISRVVDDPLGSRLSVLF